MLPYPAYPEGTDPDTLAYVFYRYCPIVNTRYALDLTNASLITTYGGDLCCDRLLLDKLKELTYDKIKKIAESVNHWIEESVEFDKNTNETAQIEVTHPTFEHIGLVGPLYRIRMGGFIFRA